MVASKAQEHIKFFKDVTAGVASRYEDSSAMVFLKKMVKSFDDVVKALDTALKGRNVDVAASVKSLKEKGDTAGASLKARWDKARERVGKEGMLGASKSLWAEHSAKSDTVSAEIRDRFKNMFQRQVGPPDPEGVPTPEDAVHGEMGPSWSQRLSDSVGGLTAAVSALAKGGQSGGAIGDPPANDSAQSGELEKRQARIDARKKEVEEEKEAVTPGRKPGDFKGTVTNLMPKWTKELSLSVTGLGKAVKTLGKSATPLSGSDGNPQSEEKGRFAGMLKKRQARIDARKKEVEEEKAAVNAKKEKGKPTSGLGAIVSAIGAAASFITGGVGKIMLGVGKFLVGGLAKAVFKGIGPLLGRLLPALSGGIASGLGTLAGGAAKLALTAGIGGLKLAGSAALAVAASPVGMVMAGVALAGALIWGGYKLYKYLNRNSIPDDTGGKLTRLRLITYGFNDQRKDYYSKLLELEMMHKGNFSVRNGKLEFKPLDSKQKKAILDIFEVERSEKTKYALLNRWYMGRFLPSLKAFLEPLLTCTRDVFVDTLDKLTPKQTLELVGQYTLPAEVFERKEIPTFDHPESPVAKQEADDLLALVRGIAKKNEGTPSSAQADKNRQDVKKAADLEAARAKAESQKLATKANQDIKPPPTAAAASAPPPKADVSLPGAEGEKSPAGGVAALKDAAESKAAVNAGGAMPKGGLEKLDKSLPGIVSNVPTSKIHSLDPNVLQLFGGMSKEYNRLTGKNVTVTDAFRSYQDQENLYKTLPKGKAAPPGKSLHEFGLAIDVDSKVANELDRMGLMKKYGFTRPIGQETWHMEPAGVSLNPQLARSDAAERMKRVLSSPGRGGGGYGTMSNAKKYGRNSAIQKQLFDQGEAVDLTEPPAKDTQDPMANAAPAAKPTAAPDTASGHTKNASSAVPEGVSTETPPQQGPSATQGASISTGTPSNAEEPPKVPAALAAAAAKTPEASVASTAKPPVSPTAPKGLDASPDAANTYQPNMDPGKSVDSLSPEEAVRRASAVVGMDPNTMLAFAKVESSMRAGVGNKTSSAKGLFQIVGRTWKGLLDKYGAQYNIPPNASPSHPYYNSLLGIAYAKENLQVVGDYKSAGLSAEAALYAAHHFGPSGAKRLLAAMRANPNASVQTAVSSETYASNKPELQGKTLGQYAQHLNQKLSKASGTPVANYAGGKQSPATPAAPNPTQPTPGTTPLDTGTPAPSVAASAPPSVSTQASPAFAGSGLYKTPPPVQSAVAAESAPSKPPERMTQAVPAFSAPEQITTIPSQGATSIDLGKTENILTRQLDTLGQIRDLLRTISQNGPMQKQGGDDSKEASDQPATQQTNRPQQGDSYAPNAKDTRQSSSGVSMSRKPMV